LYYGAYGSDRFGGGIGRRVGIDESSKKVLPGTGISRVALFSESHEALRAWATADNLRKATRIHKAAYFTRSENLVQEAVVERVRQHYVDATDYVAETPVQAALFRCEDEEVVWNRSASELVTRIPSIVRGVFDERSERCVVDFANKRLGGAWLSYGCVQEEKMFIERFDYSALCARSLVEMEDPVSAPLASPFSMRPNEAWILRGGPAFAEVPWYGRTPGDAESRLRLLDPANDRSTMPTVLAIDAIKADFDLYERQHLELMLIKAYTGFSAAVHDPDVGRSPTIATGSWGCGAFRNNERVMFVIQTLAANLAGVELTYHVLADGHRLGPAFVFLEEAVHQGLTVAQSLDMLLERCITDRDWRPKRPKRGR